MDPVTRNSWKLGRIGMLNSEKAANHSRGTVSRGPQPLGRWIAAARREGASRLAISLVRYCASLSRHRNRWKSSREEWSGVPSSGNATPPFYFRVVARNSLFFGFNSKVEDCATSASINLFGVT